MAIKVKEEEVKRIMAVMNLNHVMLADKIGMNATYLRNILSGNNAASAPFRKNLMKALEIENTPENWQSFFYREND
jgi:hypothetical protein